VIGYPNVMESETNLPDESFRSGRVRPVHVSEWIDQQRPDVHPIANADPDPTLLDHNLVVFTTDPAVARDVALAFERTRTDLSEVSTVSLGRGDHSTRPAVDAENVTTHAAKRAGLGAAIGAVVGAVVIGLGSWLLFGGTEAVIGAAIGGALFGAGVAAVWSYVIGTGQSAAFRDSFVDPELIDVVAVSVHADDPSCIDAAREAIADLSDIEVHRLDRAGRATN
jgi:hypothetical protein